MVVRNLALEVLDPALYLCGAYDVQMRPHKSACSMRGSALDHPNLARNGLCSLYLSQSVLGSPYFVPGLQGQLVASARSYSTLPVQRATCISEQNTTSSLPRS